MNPVLEATVYIHVNNVPIENPDNTRGLHLQLHEYNISNTSIDHLYTCVYHCMRHVSIQFSCMDELQRGVCSLL